MMGSCPRRRSDKDEGEKEGTAALTLGGGGEWRWGVVGTRHLHQPTIGYSIHPCFLLLIQRRLTIKTTTTTPMTIVAKAPAFAGVMGIKTLTSAVATACSLSS